MKDIFKDIEQEIANFYREADIYDALNDFDYDLPFWKKWCKKSGPTVLELCCGTGRVGTKLIEEGFDYHGVDFSPSFILASQNKVPSKDAKRFHVADVRSYHLKKKFDSIIIPFNGIGHIYTREDAEQFFSCIKKHLKKDGQFILSMFNPEPTFLIRDPNKRYPMTDIAYKTKSNRIFKITETNTYNKETQIEHVRWFFKFEKEKKELVKDFTMRIFYPQELENLLHYNGFKIVKKFGDCDETPFNSDSKKQIIICKRK